MAVSAFDQVLEEDLTTNSKVKTNRIKESYDLFKMLLNAYGFKDCQTIIFLNKKDLLKKKIREGADVTKNFPELASFKTKQNQTPVSFKGLPGLLQSLDYLHNLSTGEICCLFEVFWEKTQVQFSLNW